MKLWNGAVHLRQLAMIQDKSPYVVVLCSRRAGIMAVAKEFVAMRKLRHIEELRKKRDERRRAKKAAAAKPGDGR